jgi:uncharacterized membrane protein YbhN (UPF0104 family)
MAIGNIPKQDLLIAFFLYVISVFFKATRFRAILRSDIGLGRIFSIVSLYMFFANFLPMRAGERYCRYDDFIGNNDYSCMAFKKQTC